MAVLDTRASRFWLTGYAEEEYALDGPISAFNKSTSTFVVPVVFADADLTGVFNSTAANTKISGIDASLVTPFVSDAAGDKIQHTGADLISQFAATIAATSIRNVFSSIGFQFDVEATGRVFAIKLAEAELTSISALTVIPTRVVISSASLDSIFSDSVLALRQPRSDYRTIQVIEEDRTIFVDQETRTIVVLGEDRTLHIYGVYS